MVYNETTNRSGIIQQAERYTDLGVGVISADTNLLKDFTVYANEVGDDLWFTIFNSTGAWQWDDSNNTDLPFATTNLVSGTARYALPPGALTIKRMEVMDENGSWTTLAPLTTEKERLAISSLETQSGVPTHYFLVNDTIELYPNTNYSSTNGLKAYFDRETVAFVSTDTTKTPGIASPFHGLYPLGMAIMWLKIKQPNSASLAQFIRDFEKGKADMATYYADRWKDNTPTLITKREQSFE